ncbi:hypothetical protein ACKXGF_04990 [Alkalibacillus sp. S2W]|uniref:hypothetical protein n=1 Tax=Alkalibacillus sp. S2W TaxID=3386553 RepID=UPI00398CD544
MSKFDVVEASNAQKHYCNENNAPHFAPQSGRCWNCGSNIYEAKQKVMAKGTEYEREVTTGITVEEASNSLVTGCPHCNRSYCD